MDVLPTWVPDVETKPAPSPLLLVQAFVNTVDASSGEDLLVRPQPAQIWMRDAGLLSGDARVSPEDLSRLCRVREAIRAALAANAGHDGPDRDQQELLRRVVAGGHLRFTMSGAFEVALAPDASEPVDAAVARLLLIIRDAQRDGTWARLKACSNDECRWAYYDRSHSRRGRWCDMAGCGNRAKNRALRARRHAIAGPPA